MTGRHILVVDDEPDIRTLVQDILEDEGYTVTTAEGGESARKARRTRRPDLVLLDIWMEDIDGISLLREWSENGGLPCPVIMMSGHGTVETAVEATRLGAYDFIEKPISLAKLLLTIERAFESARLQQENTDLRGQALPVVEPVGKSASMEQLREQARKIAQSGSWVLISGEAGTGKGTFARYIHDHSPRQDGPYVEIAVGSMTGENSAAELFGHEEGEAVSYGRLEQANGGTLCIGDIADMDLQTQARLLSVFQTHLFKRVGGSEDVEVDLRIIATTHSNLEEEVAAGRFRDDLFYHLNVVPMHIPALREHADDVHELLNYYIDYLVSHERLSYRHFTVAAQNRLRSYEWPGNIRELRNLVQRLLILGSSEEIELDEVEQAISSVQPGERKGELPAMPYNLPLREAREQFEHDYLVHQLREVGGSVGKLAKRVGMERTHLYRKLRALGIDHKKGVE
ncbi:MAG: sigma-54 dependent transcriptional regulator [Gammaproteobacteria bacterium]|nr:sigma-54 dependent transcriptional regulator [Gammaproteobacteria bacterium]NNJ94215.1 sigma-54-dependent Fis family transcriptional regulator [Halobacteria archaeon]